MMGRQRTPAERAALAARIVALATDPELTHAIIAQRCGCGKGLVAEVLREAKSSSPRPTRALASLHRQLKRLARAGRLKA